MNERHWPWPPLLLFVLLWGPRSVDMHFWGSTFGIKAGHPRVYGFLEVTAGYANAETFLLGEKRDLGGFMIQPNVGVAFAW